MDYIRNNNDLSKMLFLVENGVSKLQQEVIHQNKCSQGNVDKRYDSY